MSSRSTPNSTLNWDGAVITSAMALTGLGVVMNYSTTAALDIDARLPALALRHLVGVVAAIFTAVIAAHLPLRIWERGALPLWGLSVLLLMLTPLLGIEAGGARRWIALPLLPVSIQPSEFARLASALAAAAVLAQATPKQLHSPQLLAKVAAIAAIPAGLLWLQPDLSGSVMLCAVTGLLLFAAGIPFRMLAAPVAVAASGVAIFIAANGYARARVRGFLDPWRSAEAEGFQAVQSFVAFGRGGTFGVGLGDGRQKLAYLPEAHTDFILAVVAEELGLIGVLCVIGAFAALAWAGLRVARQAKETFPLLLAVGCTAVIAIPAMCNAAVVMGLLPTTGLALPFLSHGSNSLVCTAAAVGILLRVALESDFVTPSPRSRANRGATARSPRPARARPSRAIVK